MPFVQVLVSHIPAPLLCFLITVTYAAVATVGLLISRKIYPHHKAKLHNDIAGFIFATLGVIYAVLLAFTVVITWQDFDRANEVTSNEANCLASLYRDSSPFPPALRAELKSELINYANAIVDDEWHTMTIGQRSAKVQSSQEKLWLFYAGFQPENETQKIFLIESVKKMNQASELRRQRILYASSGVHPILYFVLIAGSLITLAFAMLFGTENLIPHLTMTILLAAMIAITIFTIIALDYPFTGAVSIKSDVFSSVLTSLMK